MNAKIILLQLFLFASLSVFSQDTEGCKDHPFFTRIPNFYLTGCTTNFNEVQIRTSPEVTVPKEGNVTRLTYSFNAEAGAPTPSPLQVIKNYENIILQYSGKKLYASTGNDGYQGATFTMKKNDKEYWVLIDKMTPGIPDVCESYELQIIEMGEMKQEVNSGAMFDELNKSGSITLYILFDTDKATIKAESQEIVNQIAEMMKANETLNIRIEGHTDSLGNAGSNVTLSEDRAKAIMNVLIEKDIKKHRLATKGWGGSKPIADNKVEEGRAKNRRVEIIKQ